MLPNADVTIEIDRKKYGLMLAVQSGQKMWNTSYAKSLANQYYVGEADKASLPPEQEFTMAQDEWHGGIGQKVFSDVTQVYKTDGVDTRIRGVLTLSPLINDAGINFQVVKYLDYEGNLYAICSNFKVYQISGGVPSLVYSGSGTVTDAIVFGGYVLVAVGSSTKYWYSNDTTDLSDWTQATPDESVADYFGKVGTLLWKVNLPNDARYSADPTNAVNPWSTAEYIGDSSSEVTDICDYNGEIHFGKENGLYKIDFNGDLIDLLAPFKFISSSNNFSPLVAWSDLLVFPILNSLYVYNGDYLVNISPSTYMPTVVDYTGFMRAIVADTDWLYVVVDPAGDNNNAVLMACRLETIYGDTDYRWHALEEISGVDAATSAFISTTDSDNAQLWISGYHGASTYYSKYITLPKYSSAPWEDSNYKFCSSGTMETSYFTANFENMDKALFSFMLFADNLSRLHRTVKIEYMFEEDSEWTTLATFFFSAYPYKDTQLPEGTAGKKVKFRLTLSTDDSTETPRVNGYLCTARLSPRPLKRYDFYFKCTDNVPGKDGQPIKFTAGDYLKLFDNLMSRSYPFKIYEYLTGKAAFVTLEAPTPEYMVLKEENNNRAESVMHITALQARIE